MPLTAGAASTRRKPPQQPLPAFPPVVHPTADAIAAHAIQCWHLLLDARKEIAPVVTEHAFVTAQLEDPALADHPMRTWGERRARNLANDLSVGLNVLLGHLHGLEAAWMALTPYDRDHAALDVLTGMPADAPVIGPALAFIDSGPLQEAGAFPADWEPPPEVVATLPHALQECAGFCPF